MDVRWVGSHDISDAAGQNIAEEAESRTQNGIGFKLPGEGGSRLQDRERRGGKDVAEVSLDGGVERLIYIVRNGSKRGTEARDLLMRI